MNDHAERLKLGFGELWINQHIDDKDLPVIKQRLLDQSQLIRSQISASPKYTYYKYLIDVYSLQYYLFKFIPVHLRKCINKFRLSSHILAIETGRYIATDRSKRTCFSCVDEIEDEYHFILVCPLYHSLRKQYIKPYYWKNTSVYKLIKLLKINNIKKLRQFGKYLYSATNLRYTFYIDQYILFAFSCLYILIHTLLFVHHVVCHSLLNR